MEKNNKLIICPVLYFTTGTAHDMNMRAARFFKKTGDKYFYSLEHCSTDRTDPAAAPFQAINAAGNMH
jgi:hypothetical protein